MRIRPDFFHKKTHLVSDWVYSAQAKKPVTVIQ